MSLVVLATGPLTTVQDEGRIGHASSGVTRSGACDRAAYRLGNRLLGNLDGAASLEVTLGGLVLAAEAALTLAVTGARCPGVPWNAPFRVDAGDEVRVGLPGQGLRSYLAVRGGVDVPAVLGSRSTDTLSGLGPAPLRPGDRLPVGQHLGAPPGVDHAATLEPAAGVVLVRVLPGPRRDRVGEAGWDQLLGSRWTASPHSNRIGLRLLGAELRPVAAWQGRELASEGLLRGAVQLPPSGHPVVFLADHPVTGGYPVIGYVVDGDRTSDVDRLAQVRPGQPVRFGER